MGHSRANGNDGKAFCCVLWHGGRHQRIHIIQVTPLGYFTHVSITTPIVSALKNHYI
jgi:hypothetical protein